MLDDFYHRVLSDPTVQSHYIQPQLTPIWAFIKLIREDVPLIGCSIIHDSRSFSWITEFQQCGQRGRAVGVLAKVC